MNKHQGSLGWDGSGFNQMPVPAPVDRRELAPRQQIGPGYPPFDPAAQGGNLVGDLVGYLMVILRHRWVVLSIIGAFVGVGLVFTFLATPIYRASTTLQIDRQAAKVVETNALDEDIGGDAAFWATQFEILKSRSLAENVVSEFSLDELKSFVGTKPQSSLGTLWRKIAGGTAGDSAQNLSAAEFESLRKAAAQKVMGGLTVQPVGNSRVVRLSYESPEPVWAQKITNAVASSYVASTLNNRFEASSYARKFLEEKLQELKVKLQDSEEQLVKYAQAQKIVNVDERRSLVSANLEALNSELAKTSRERLKSEQLLNQANTNGGLALPQILGDESVRSMRSKRAELATEYQDKLGLFKPAFPEMKMLMAQIAELDKQLEASVNLVRDSIKVEYEGARAQEAILTQQLEALKNESLDLESRGIDYRILQREVDTNRQLYDGLLQRYKEVGVAGAVGTNNVTVIDTAERPRRPFKPSLSLNLALALAAGLCVGGAAAFGIEYFDDTFKGPEELESKLGLAVLGVIPSSKTPGSHEEALLDPRSAVSEAYRSLRTALQFSTADGAPKTLLVTSSRPNEGKSTTAVSLATNFAQLGTSVLLIDGDLRNPSLHRILKLSSAVGLSNYLAGDSVAGGSFQPTDQPGLTLMSSGPLPPNPAELLAGPKMASLLAVAAEKFGMVIIDGPPVMGIADAPLLSSVAEGTLLVVESGQTRRGLSAAALKRLYYARARMVGALLNKFDARKVGHTYGYGYGYADYSYGGDSAAPQLADQST